MFRIDNDPWARYTTCTTCMYTFKPVRNSRAHSTAKFIRLVNFCCRHEFSIFYFFSFLFVSHWYSRIDVQVRRSIKYFRSKPGEQFLTTGSRKIRSQKALNWLEISFEIIWEYATVGVDLYDLEGTTLTEFRGRAMLLWENRRNTVKNWNHRYTFTS